MGTNNQVLAIIDTRRAGPGSPRGRRRGTGRSYHDLSTVRDRETSTENIDDEIVHLEPKHDDSTEDGLHLRKKGSEAKKENEVSEQNGKDKSKAE